jgi:hypothetical protein
MSGSDRHQLSMDYRHTEQPMQDQAEPLPPVEAAAYTHGLFNY